MLVFLIRDEHVWTSGRGIRVLRHWNCQAWASGIASSAGSPDFLKGDIRVAKDLDGLGCLGDMGWYCVRAILWAFSWDLPHSVQASPGDSCAPYDRSKHRKPCLY